MKLPRPSEIIENSKLFLKIPSAKDAAEIFNFTQNKKLMKFFPWTPPRTVLEAQRHIRSRKIRARQGKTFEACLYEKKTKQLIGSVGIVNFISENATAELGYWIGAPFWKKGYAFRGCQLLIHYTFTNLGVHRIIIQCNSKNIASRKLAEKLGFRLDGILRAHAKKGRQFIDKCYYTLLKSEWSL